MADLDRPRTPAQWDAVLKQLREKMHLLAQLPAESSQAERMAARGDQGGSRRSLTRLGGRPQARDRASGHGRGVVAAMPPAQVLLIAMMETERELRDDVFKASYLPYADARRVLDAVEQKTKTVPDSESNLLSRLLLPAISKVMVAPCPTRSPDDAHCE